MIPLTFLFPRRKFKARLWNHFLRFYNFTMCFYNPLTAKNEISLPKDLTFLWTWILRWVPKSSATHASLCITLSLFIAHGNMEAHHVRGVETLWWPNETKYFGKNCHVPYSLGYILHEDFRSNVSWSMLLASSLST